MGIKKGIKNAGRRIIAKFYPEINKITDPGLHWRVLQSNIINCTIEEPVKFYSPYKFSDSKIGKYTYFAPNAVVSQTDVGRFCSIGPNLVCGWGIHPIEGISTAPMFYSTLKQNGLTLSEVDKVEERKRITIGNDVFIGANVVILDGITIGDGAVIGAGAVVSKNIPPYAVAVGSPIEIKKFRFTPDQIEKLLRIKWWDFEEEKLKEVERSFFEIDKFLKKIDN